MRIAVFVPSFPSISETFILRQITGLIDLGHDVDVYAERRPERDTPIHRDVAHYQLLDRTVYVGDEMPTATGYWEMPVWPLAGKTWLPGRERPIPNRSRLLRALPVIARNLIAHPRLTVHTLDPREFGYQARSLSTLYRLDKLRRFNKCYDVLHAHFGPQGNTFRFTRELWDAPLIVSFHGYDFSTFPREQGPNVYDRLFASADLVTVNSQYALDRLQELGCPNEKLRRLNYGVDLCQFESLDRSVPDGEPIRVLTVGRLVEKKGIEYAIRSLARIKDSHPLVRYEVVGDGPLRPVLESLISDLGMHQHVTLHGLRESAFVRQLMRECHVFVLPSLTSTDGDQEGTPVTLMEAQATGMVVISTRHSGIPEVVIDHVTGYLVSERSIDELAGCLAAVIDHPEDWARVRRAARTHVEGNFDIRGLNRDLSDLYLETYHQFARRKRQ